MIDLTATKKLVENRINAFFELFENGRVQPTLVQLATALDGLVAAYFETPGVEPESEEATKAPNIDERSFAERAAELFPALRWFCTVEPDGEIGQEVGMSDPCGDLAEIANDLDHILWEFRNGSVVDGIWEFRFGYQSHWGRHLHEVRLYLHTQCAW